MSTKGISCEGKDLIQLAQDSVLFTGDVSTVLNL